MKVSERTMLDVLAQVENELPKLLEDESRWNSLFVDYHHPIVERLWCSWSDFRIYLHRIHPCEAQEAFFHPHPWPSAMRVLEGTYEMALGYAVGEEEPPIARRLTLGAGSTYEMIDPNDWHYVRPIGGPTLSLMITGKPWDRSSPKSDKSLNPLSVKQKKELLTFFRDYYSQPHP